MKKVALNSKVQYTTFGSNNYTNGMEAVIFDPETITWEEIRCVEGFYLNPFYKPNSQEIFSLKGTQEQYSKWYRDGIVTHSTKKAVQKYGLRFNDECINRQREELIEKLCLEFKPWYILDALSV